MTPGGWPNFVAWVVEWFQRYSHGFSIASWSLLLQMNERLRVTPFAAELMARDPLFSHPSTAWILHHVLVSREDSPTAWQWFFCKSGLATFTKEQFLEGLRAYIAASSNQKYAARSLEGDFHVLTRMYQSAGHEGDALLYPSVFSPLGLIEKNAYQDRYRRILNPPVPVAVFLYCLALQARQLFPDAAVLDLELLRTQEGSPFLSFGLSLNAFFERMRGASADLKKVVTLSHTAGMHTIAFKKKMEADLLDLAFQERTDGFL